MSSLLFSVRAWRVPIMTAIVGAILSLAFSLTSPMQYSATMRVLITQPSASGLDPYTAIKSTERVASSLAELVHTTTFMASVLDQATSFDQSYFPADDYARRQAWKRAVDTAIVPGTGIMTATAYHIDRDQARILVDGTAKQLALQAPNYFGTTIRVQVIDTPLNSRWFARPDFVANGGFGFVIGGLVGMVWVLMKSIKHQKREFAS